MNIFLFDFQVKGLSSSRVYQELRLEYIPITKALIFKKFHNSGRIGCQR